MEREIDVIARQLNLPEQVWRNVYAEQESMCLRRHAEQSACNVVQVFVGSVQTNGKQSNAKMIQFNLQIESLSSSILFYTLCCSSVCRKYKQTCIYYSRMIQCESKKNSP